MSLATSTIIHPADHKQDVSLFTCSICNHIVYDPRVAACKQHMFCGGCLSDWIQRQTTCPICRQPTGVKDLSTLTQSNPIVALQLNAIRIVCPHRDPTGCTWTGAYSDLSTHLTQQCNFEPIPCQNSGCEVKLKRSDSKQHESEQCPFRRIQCKQCEDPSILVSQLDQHLADMCPKTKIICKTVYKQDGCDQQVTRDQLSRHHNQDCPNVVIECPFRAHGCTFRGARVYAHPWTSDEHTQLLLKVIADQQQIIRALQVGSLELPRKKAKTPSSSSASSSASSSSAAVTRSIPTSTPTFADVLHADHSFKAGNLVDVRDEIGKWLLAEIRQVQPTQVLVHYLDWDSTWDTWISRTSCRLAPCRLYSSGQMTECEIKQFAMHHPVWVYVNNGGGVGGKWVRGEISNRDNRQVQVSWRDDKSTLYQRWFHCHQRDIQCASL